MLESMQAWDPSSAGEDCALLDIDLQQGLAHPAIPCIACSHHVMLFSSITSLGLWQPGCCLMLPNPFPMLGQGWGGWCLQHPGQC